MNDEAPMPKSEGMTKHEIRTMPWARALSISCQNLFGNGDLDFVIISSFVIRLPRRSPAKAGHSSVSL
ncbi:MAG: hypothetical protein DME75_09015 [Verrucomicrobia bacterium]|nr:MAG: hypothetical protein DME75_09015 [Verrucomicrobiota bacterium]